MTEALVRSPAGVGEFDRAFVDHQPGGSQPGDGRVYRHGVNLPGSRYPANELAAVDAAVASRGDDKDEPLVEGDSAAGQQRLE